MLPFLLLLLLWIGYNNTALALDFPTNLDSVTNNYRQNNQLEEAVTYLDRLLVKAEKEYGNQSDTFAFYLYHKADIIKEIGRYNDALELFMEVINIYENNYSETHIKLVQPLTYLAKTHLKSGQYNLAQKNLNRALDITQQATPNDLLTIAHIYNFLSITYYETSDYNKGLEFGKKALEIQTNASEKDDKELITSYDNIAVAYSALQQYDDALAMLKQALYLKQKKFSPYDLELANSLNNLASLYNKMKRVDEALPYYQKALEIIKENKGARHPEVAIYLNNLANCYQYLKEFETVELLLLEAIDIFTEALGEEHPNTIIFINNLGGLYDNMKNFEKARKYYQKAVALATKVLGTEHVYYLNFRGNLATAQLSLNNAEEALEHYQALIKIAKKVLGSNSVQVVMYHNQMAVSYLALGANFYDDALKHVEKSMIINALDTIEISAIGNNLADLSKRTFISNTQFQRALKILADLQKAIYEDTNNKEFLLNSYKTHKALVYFLQHCQKNIYTSKDKLRASKHITNISSRAIALLKELESVGETDRTTEAITFAEYNKSAVLSSVLQGNQALNFGEIPNSLQKQERALKKEKDLIKKKIIQSTKNKDEEGMNAATQELVEVQLQQDKLRQLLQDNYPKYNALKNEQKILTATLIQEQLLEPQSALLEYCVYDSASYVIVITPSTVQLQQLPIQKKELQQKIRRFRTSLSNYTLIRDNEQEMYLMYTQTAHELYQLLIAPIQPYLSNSTHLIIVPDNDLNHIPFETLLSTLPKEKTINYKNLDYLLYDYTIRYSYSASLLLENKRYKYGQNNGKILGFAASYTLKDSTPPYRSPSNIEMRKQLNALPGATREIQALQTQFGNSDFFLGQQATEALFKEKAAHYAVLHLALHGIVNNHHPLLSSLAFTEDFDSTENNFLEAHEISNLQLYNDLVVLSACETGYGKFEQGEGVLSLARSFMYAGTPSLVVSLWDVDDASTAIIMRLFYQHLAKGMKKDAALRQAKLQFIEQTNGITINPAFWSPFIILGDNQAVYLKAPAMRWKWQLLGGGLAFLSSLLLFRRKRLRKKETA